MPRLKAVDADTVHLGTELNIEDVRTEAELVTKWARHVLAMCDGNKCLAARVLGIDRRSLYRRLGFKYKSDEKRGTYAVAQR